jgi:hypothetical protein
MIDPDSSVMIRRMSSQWDDLRTEIERMQATAEVYPENGNEVFKPIAAPATSVGFEIGPVVFNLPERANSTSIDLFVVVGGRLSFDRRLFQSSHQLVTDSFASHIGYFRGKSRTLTHVFGAHYDLARNEVGHPVFHAQLKSFSNQYAEVVRKYFNSRFGDDEVDDPVKRLLRTVRVPTAQMDVFSIFVQLCADHLLSKDSGSEEKRAFNSLLRKGEFCQGAAFRAAGPNDPEAPQCFRSRHWYPAIM